MKKIIVPVVACLTVVFLIFSTVFCVLTFTNKTALTITNEQLENVSTSDGIEKFINVPYEQDIEFVKIVYVSPDGDDSDTGESLETAVTSIKQAQIIVREFYASGGNGNSLILLDDGEYFMGKTMEISEEDVAGGKLYIRSINNNKATISGSKIVDRALIIEETDPNLGRVWKIPCSEKINQLYINNTYATRARYPDIGEEFRVLTTDNTYRDIIIDGDNFTQFEENDFDDSVMTVMVMWGESYLRVKDFKQEKVNIDIDGQTAERNIVRVSIDGRDSVVFARSGLEINENSRCAFHFENSKAFLNICGEWYYDQTEKMIYYIPYEFEKIENVVIRLPETEILLSVAGKPNAKIHGLQIEGVNFKYTANTYVDGKIGGQGNRNDNPYTKRISGGANDARPVAALSFENTEDIVLRGNVFSCLGGGAVDFVSGAENIKIEKNLFNSVGGNGVLVGPTATAMYTTKVVNGQTVIDQWNVPYADRNEYNISIYTDNNYFNDIGWQEYSGTAVIYTYAADSKIRYNTIDNVRYTGISIGWGWDTTATPYDFTKNYEVSHNRISNVVNLMSDGGSIYTIGVQEGTKIHNNYIYNSHDSVYCYPDSNTSNGQKSYASAAIYLDNTSGGTSTDGSGFDVYNNYIAENTHYQKYLTVNARNGIGDIKYWRINDATESDRESVLKESGVQQKGFTLLSETPVLTGYYTNSETIATVYGYNLKDRMSGVLILRNSEGKYVQLAGNDIISWNDTEIVFKSGNYISGMVYYVSDDLTRSNMVAVTLNVDRKYCMDGYFEEKWGGLLTLARDLQTETVIINKNQVKASSTLGAFAPSNVIDQQTASLWASADSDMNPWLEINMEDSAEKISKIVLRARTDGGGDAESRTNLTIEVKVKNGNNPSEYVVLKNITDQDHYEANGIFVIDLDELGYDDKYIFGVKIRKTDTSDSHFLCIADIILVS